MLASLSLNASQLVSCTSGNCEDLGLSFTIDQNNFGKVVSRGILFTAHLMRSCAFLHVSLEIKPGGAAIAVSEDNKYEYIHLMADYRLNRECKDQFKALTRGFHSIISERWLGFFSPVELQKLMCGENVEFGAYRPL